ncbi:MAG: isoprenylcysteine carboxylmethyltransferase family protein [Acidobacteria bacterium]|nr:isoprenylcysteine carboxylmethyltransferase family protein [Acidobacteriota bacterium]
MQAAAGVVFVSWVAYWGLLGIEYLSAERRRRRDGDGSRRRADNRSMGGLLLEFIAFATVCLFRRETAGQVPETLLWLAALLAVLAVLMGALPGRSLGREFRLQAMVTEDHRLATGGPYRVVRHPIYASLLALLLATGITITQWTALAVSVLIFLMGTEIRVRVEDALLARRFGAEFDAYRKRTAAYIPFVR